MGMKARDGVLGIPVSLYGYFSLWNSAGLEGRVNLHPSRQKLSSREEGSPRSIQVKEREYGSAFLQAGLCIKLQDSASLKFKDFRDHSLNDEMLEISHSERTP